MNAFNKDVYREIKNSFGRFIGIFAIVALGVAFYAGIGATGMDMRLTGDDYLDKTNLMDIRVVSTMGLNKNDIKAISQVPGIKQIFPTYNLDAMVTHSSKSAIVKIHAYDTKTTEAHINAPDLLEGRLPVKGNEALVEYKFLTSLGYEIGDTFTFESGKKKDIRNDLRTSTYKIVGIVNSPYYLSLERGTGSIGNGKIDCYAMIPQENFRQTLYSEAFITLEGTEELLCFSEEYKDKVKETVKLIEDVGDRRIKERNAEMTVKAFDELNEADKGVKTGLETAQVELSESEGALYQAQGQINDAESDIILGQLEINESITIIEAQKSEVLGGLARINQAEIDLNSQERGLRDSKFEIETLLDELDMKKRQLDENERMIKIAYANDEQTLSEQLMRVTAGKAILNDNEGILLKSLDDIEAGLVLVADSRISLEAQRSFLNESLIAIDNGIRELDDAQISLINSYSEILSNELELNKNLAEFETVKSDSLKKLEDAAVQISETRKIINDIDEPKWYILKRDSNMGYSSYSEDSDKIEAIGQVFPMIFFIVAALVSLTTMTRMIEERRTEIGTLKSLGFSNNKILSKYIIYAAAPTLFGGLIGGVLGMQTFPKIIINAYSMLYIIPSAITPVLLNFLIVGLLIGVVSTITATYLACMNELKETPSNLMRPKAPKAGKRNILERIGILWKALSFSQKVTVRNILRYKKRLYMTVIGIGGCTALLMTGFGLKDSIGDIIGKQFGEINHYDMSTTFNDSAKSKDIEKVESLLSSSPVISSTMKVRQKAFDICRNDEKDQQATLMVPENIGTFEDFIELKDRTSKRSIDLPESGLVITEKVAKTLGLKIGDTMYIKDDDDKRVEAVITDITENYFLHYIYMTKEYYEAIFAEKVEYNVIYSKIADKADSAGQDEIAKKILDERGVSSVSFTESMINNFQDVVENLNFVVIVLIVSAGALAFVVLLNLTNININERKRELATIEVLGFYDDEVSAYIYRENSVLTIIGILLGMILGVALHLYVILTAETDTIMFGRDIKLMSYVYSALLTIVFSACVNVLTGRKLKRINMVEALKSVE